MKKFNKVALIVTGIVIGILLLAFIIVDTYYFPMVNGTVDSSNVALVDVKVTDKEITLSMNQCTSACFATHIQPKYKDGTLYIKYRGGVFTGGLAGLNEPTIVTIPNKYGAINAVSELDLNGVTPIWTKTDGLLANKLTEEELNTSKEQLPALIDMLLMTCIKEEPIEDATKISMESIESFVIFLPFHMNIENNPYDEKHIPIEIKIKTSTADDGKLTYESPYAFTPLKCAKQVVYELFGIENFFVERNYDKEWDGYAINYEIGTPNGLDFKNLDIQTDRLGNITASLDLTDDCGYEGELGWEEHGKYNLYFKVMKENGHIFTRFLRSEKC